MTFAGILLTKIKKYQKINKQKIWYYNSPTIYIPNNMLFVCIYPFKAAHETKSNIFLDSDDLTMVLP